MSTVTLKTQQNIQPTADPTQVIYQITFTVTAAFGIDKELFVASVGDDTVQYIAKVRDLLVYPNTKAQAISQGLDFYRVAQYPGLSYTSLSEAENATAVIQAAVQAVNIDWGQNNQGTTFGGTTTVTYDSSTT
jgi:hypothetical protein